MSVITAMMGSINRITAQAGLGKKQDPTSKITTAKRAEVWLKL
jgi:hypothetical protein